MTTISKPERDMLLLIYELSEGQEAILNRKSISAAAGFTPRQGERVLKQLTARRMIRYILFGSLAITEAGVITARKLIAEKLPKVFLSYRREDTQDLTERLYDRLVETLGSSSVFMDVDGKIQPGADFSSVLTQTIKSCAVMLVMIGPNWLRQSSGGLPSRLHDTQDYVRREIIEGLENRLQLIPVLVNEASMPTETDLPDSMRGIRSRQAMRLRRGSDFVLDSDKIIRHITIRNW